MSLDVFMFIMCVLVAIFITIIAWFVFKFLVKGVLGGIITVLLCFVGAILSFFVLLSFRNSITSDYRCVDTLDTYKVYNISFDQDNTIIHYLDNNKEVKHIKSDKAKIFYDLNDDHEPYAVRNQYWRWFIYWEELEVHIKE